jgi:hypothetical protein
MFPKDADNRLSYTKLLHHLDRTHPREVSFDPRTGEPEYKKHPICRGTSTGWPCCTRNIRKSDLSQYGTGVVVYFQFLKFMVLTYLGLFLLSVPAFILYYSGNAFMSTRNSEFKSVIAQFSLGNIGQASTACNSAQMVTTTNPESINLFCSYGNLDTILEFGQTLVSSHSTCKTDLYFTPDTCSY